MLLKWIQCKPLAGEQEAFHLGQQGWKALEKVPGFCGQVGGWYGDPVKAGVLGWWQDQKAYDHFMNQVHDQIFDQHGQKASYQDIKVEIYRQELLIPGHPAGSASNRSILQEAGFVRMAFCRIKEGRSSHFLETQEHIWNPGMAQQPGMLGGALHICRTDPQDALVVTLWKSEEAHQAYRKNLFPDLKRKARTGLDLDKLGGKAFTLNPTWTVLPCTKTFENIIQGEKP